MKRKNTAETIEAFWAKVDKNGAGGCWLWTGAKTIGYGRVSWALTNGQIAEGLYALHKCDNPGCVNPSHLHLGDQMANMADKKSRNRQTKGETNASTKLTEAQVLAIRADNRVQEVIAKDYGICNQTVSSIKLRKNWAWLK